MSEQKIHIVGGGLVGSLATIFLAQRDFEVVLYERRPDMRKEAISAGRSINLAVTARGLKALDEVGLLDEVLRLAIPMKGRMLHDLDGKTTFVPYGQKENEVINSISRGDLNKLLLSKAESYPNVRIVFNRRCNGYSPDSKAVSLVGEDSAYEGTVLANVVIGADGGGSALRKAMAQHVKKFSETADTLAHGYKELTMPPAPKGGFLMEKNALHIWPRKNFMLIALPNIDGSFTVTFFFPHEGEQSFAMLKTEADVQAFFEKTFPDATKLMPALAKEFFENPTGSMTTVKCQPWHIGDKMMMIGDAAHAIVPFFGQGMNCGFEDCSALGRLLDEHGDDWKKIFKKLEAERKPSSDAIADMALENFIEMRDTVTDAKFHFKKQIGFELERRYPGKFVPRYAMVVFHPEISYADAKKRSEAQDKILETLISNASSMDDVNWDKAAKLIAASGK